jgi:hypothetical protein
MHAPFGAFALTAIGSNLNAVKPIGNRITSFQ